MGSRPVFDRPCGGSVDGAGMVHVQLGNAFRTVQQVADNLPAIAYVAHNMEAVVTLATQIADLPAAVAAAGQAATSAQEAKDASIASAGSASAAANSAQTATNAATGALIAKNAAEAAVASINSGGQNALTASPYGKELILTQDAAAAQTLLGLGGSINITRFGAKEGGAVDCSNALKQALEFANSLHRGGSIQIPTGVWRFASAVELIMAAQVSISIVGDGMGVTNLIWESGANGGMSFRMQEGNWWLQEPGMKGNGLTISDLSMISKTANGGTGITVYGGMVSGRPAPPNTIKNVLFRGMTQNDQWSRCVYFYRVAGTLLDNVWGYGAILTTTAIGAQYGGAAGSQATQHLLSNCNFTYFDTAVKIDTNIEGHALTNFNATYVNYGIGANAGNGAVGTQLSCLGGQIAARLAGIACSNYADVMVQGTLFYIGGGATPAVGIRLNHAARANISNNSFCGGTNARDNGVVFSADGQQWTASQSTWPSIVADNTFIELSAAVILQPGTRSVKVLDNSYGNTVLNRVIDQSGLNYVAPLVYAKRHVVNLNGNITQYIDVPLPQGMFAGPPVAGFCDMQSADGQLILGWYHTPTSTAQQATFVLARRDGLNVIPGTYAFNIVVFG